MLSHEDLWADWADFYIFIDPTGPVILKTGC